MGLLGAIAAGRMMGGAGQSHDDGRAARFSRQAQEAGAMVQYQSEVLERTAEARDEARKERDKFQVYANRLNANLIARKHSQHELLAALKESNYNHPLASEEGFEARVAELLKEQYAEIDELKANGQWDEKGNQLPHIKKTLDEYTLGKEENRKVL